MNYKNINKKEEHFCEEKNRVCIKKGRARRKRQMPLNCVCSIKLQNSGRYHLQKQDPCLCMHPLLDFFSFSLLLEQQGVSKGFTEKNKIQGTRQTVSQWQENEVKWYKDRLFWKEFELLHKQQIQGALLRKIKTVSRMVKAGKRHGFCGYLKRSSDKLCKKPLEKSAYYACSKE